MTTGRINQVAIGKQPKGLQPEADRKLSAENSHNDTTNIRLQTLTRPTGSREEVIHLLTAPEQSQFIIDKHQHTAKATPMKHNDANPHTQSTADPVLFFAKKLSRALRCSQASAAKPVRHSQGSRRTTARLQIV